MAGEADRVAAALTSLAETPDGAIERIKMCDQCRVETFYQVDDYA